MCYLLTRVKVGGVMGVLKLIAFYSLVERHFGVLTSGALLHLMLRIAEEPELTAPNARPI